MAILLGRSLIFEAICQNCVATDVRNIRQCQLYRQNVTNDESNFEIKEHDLVCYQEKHFLGHSWIHMVLVDHIAYVCDERSLF